MSPGGQQGRLIVQRDRPCTLEAGSSDKPLPDPTRPYARRRRAASPRSRTPLDTNRLRSERPPPARPEPQNDAARDWQIWRGGKPTTRWRRPECSLDALRAGAMIAMRGRLRRWPSETVGQPGRSKERVVLEAARGSAPRHERDRSNDCSPPAWRLERVGAKDSNPSESPAQGHSPRGNGGDLVDREKQRSTDQPQDPQSPRWQTHGESNANHHGDKPAEQDPIDNLTNYPTSRGRFEL